MHRVTKLVEQSFHRIVVQQRRRAVRPGREIAHERNHRALILAIGQALAVNDRKHGEVIEFPFARIKIEIEEAQRLACLRVGHAPKVADRPTHLYGGSSRSYFTPKMR